MVIPLERFLVPWEAFFTSASSIWTPDYLLSCQALLPYFSNLAFKGLPIPGPTQGEEQWALAFKILVQAALLYSHAWLLPDLPTPQSSYLRISGCLTSIPKLFRQKRKYLFVLFCLPEQTRHPHNGHYLFKSSFQPYLILKHSK